MRTPFAEMKRILDLSWRDRLLVAESIFTLTAAQIMVRLMPYSWWKHEVLRSAAPPRRAAVPRTPASGGEAVVGIFGGVAARHPLAPSCLVRCLALHRLLARRGIQCHLRFGSSLTAGDRVGHCWLEQGGQPLYGQNPQRFGTLRGRER